MSIVARSEQYAGFGTFRRSCVCCVSVERSVAVKCLARLVGGRGMSGVISFRISLSRILVYRKMALSEIWMALE